MEPRDRECQVPRREVLLPDRLARPHRPHHLDGRGLQEAPADGQGREPKDRPRRCPDVERLPGPHHPSLDPNPKTRPPLVHDHERRETVGADSVEVLEANASMTEENLDQKEGSTSESPPDISLSRVTDLGLKALQFVAVAFSSVFASGWIVRAIALGTSNLPELETSKEVAVTLGFCFIASVALPLSIIFNIIRRKGLSDFQWLALLPLSTFPMLIALTSPSTNEATLYAWLRYYANIIVWILVEVFVVKIFQWSIASKSKKSRLEKQKLLAEAKSVNQRAVELIAEYEEKRDSIDEDKKQNLEIAVNKVRSDIDNLQSQISDLEPRVDSMRDTLHKIYKDFSGQWSYVVMATLSMIFIVDFGIRLVPTFPQAMGGLSPVRAEFRIRGSDKLVKGFIVAEDKSQIIVDVDKPSAVKVSSDRLYYYPKSDIEALARFRK